MASLLGRYELMSIADESAQIVHPTLGSAARRTAGGGNDSAKRRLAERLATLDGAVLAVIDNRAGNRQLAKPLIDALRRRFSLSDVIHVEKDTVNVPPRPKDWADVAARATAGITLFGA